MQGTTILNLIFFTVSSTCTCFEPKYMYDIIHICYTVSVFVKTVFLKMSPRFRNVYT